MRCSRRVKMQQLQFSISCLQTTEVSFTSVLETEVRLTSVLETEVKISFTPAPLFQPLSTIINFWKSFQPPLSFQTPQLFGTLE